MMHPMRMSLLAVTAAFSSTAFAQSNAIVVTVNGNPVQFAGQGPMMNGDRVFVPLRGVFQSMGANVDWDPTSQTVRADRGPTHVKLTIGQLTAAINGQPTTLDVAAQIVNGSTMVPLRFVGEALGGTVDWQAPTQTVAIVIGDYNIPPHPHDWGRHDHPHFNPPPGPPPGGPPPGPPPGAFFPPPPPIIHVGTMISASLSIDLSSEHNRPGDVIYANINDRAAGLPPGSRVRGVVDTVRPRAGGHPGQLSMHWTHVVLPNGKQVPVNGEFVAKQGPHGEHFSVGANVGIRLKQDVHFKK